MGVGLVIFGLAAHAHAQGSVDAGEPGAELIAAQAQALELEPVAPGARGELSLVLLDAPERDLPLLLRIVDEGPVALDDNRFDWSAVVDPLALQPRLRAPFTAPADPGTYEVHASVEYYVCNERWCRLQRGSLTWVLQVSAP